MMDRLFFSTLLVAVAALGVITAHEAMAVAPRQLAMHTPACAAAAPRLAVSTSPCVDAARQAAANAEPATVLR